MNNYSQYLSYVCLVDSLMDVNFPSERFGPNQIWSVGFTELLRKDRVPPSWIHIVEELISPRSKMNLAVLISSSQNTGKLY